MASNNIVFTVSSYLLTFPLWEQIDEVLRMSSLDNAVINYIVL